MFESLESELVLRKKLAGPKLAGITENRIEDARSRRICCSQPLGAPRFSGLTPSALAGQSVDLAVPPILYHPRNRGN